MFTYSEDMPDDLLSDDSIEEGKVDLLNAPEVVSPPGQEAFSMEAQKDKFLGGSKEDLSTKGKEDLAMDKVKDISEGAWSHRAKIDKFGQVLKQGAVSSVFANRGKIENFDFATSSRPNDPNT